MVTGKKVLVLAPHTDDAELGCGGTMARFAEEHRELFVSVFSNAEDSVPPGWPANTLRRECEASLPKLGVLRRNVLFHNYKVRYFSSIRQKVLEDMIELKKRIRPDIVLMPSPNDLHQDHQVVCAEAMRAFKESTMFGYEIPWNQLDSYTNAFMVLNKTHIKRKWTALSQYKSQLSLGRPYFQKDYVESLARIRGLQVKMDWAEAFQVLRIKI